MRQRIISYECWMIYFNEDVKKKCGNRDFSMFFELFIVEHFPWILCSVTSESGELEEI